MTMAKISQGHILAWQICEPPLDEQEKIVEYLDEELGKLSTLTDQAIQAIDLMIERRVALILAAVTGKIDVRGLA